MTETLVSGRLGRCHESEKRKRKEVEEQVGDFTWGQAEVPADTQVDC